MRWSRALACASACAIAAACAPSGDDAASSDSDIIGLEHGQSLADGESSLTILATNDVHGSIDRFPQLAGYVNATRAHVDHSYGDRGGLLVLDAGDATQGTLLANYSEGLSVIRAMNAVGYTAAIAGNHGFDFGPVDWTHDRCDASMRTCDPLAALERTVHEAKFPFLAANVTKQADGKALDFLPPYELVPFQGRNVAVIGLENHFTSRTTVPENVSALTFGDGTQELTKIVEDLFTAGKADVFVLVMHEGDGETANMAFFLAGLPRRSDGAPLVDVAIAGHSHTLNDSTAKDIPYIQSGANGELFGIVEMVLKKDEQTGRLSVEHERLRKKAGIPIAERPSGFLLEKVTPVSEVADIVSAARREVAPIADRFVVNAPQAVSRDDGRISDSEIGNVVTDAMRAATGADIALINGGDIRADLPAGKVTYESLFAVLPKNLELVTLKDMPTEKLIANIKLSITSCGRRGALQLSGATITFTRNCRDAHDGEDRGAKLISIPGIFHRDGDTEVIERPTVTVVTTDFVMSGGSGYDQFAGLTASGPTQPLRDAVAAELTKEDTLDPAKYARGRYAAQ